MSWLRVDTRFGHGFFNTESPEQVKNARDLFEAEGVRIRLCRDFSDEGTVLDGLPLEVNFERKQAVVN